jgi:alkane 1-monooxygenase
MPIRSLKYLLPLSFYATAWIAFTQKGWWAWIPMVYAWMLIPLTELLLKPNTQNLSSAETDLARTNPMYDWMLYLIVPIQYGALFFFLFTLSTQVVDTFTLAGRICSMGMLCGTFGINVAHELGHRKNQFERLLANALLATSLYMHFYIEHNKGHHKNVATPDDPSSARRNEIIYLFWFRTIIFSYLSAWNIACEDCRKAKKTVWGLSNEMLRAHLIQGALIAIVFMVFGTTAGFGWLGAALMGILLLETVNYIEHYGLTRKKTASGLYERATPIHSWNSNHPLGRMMLFELSRHSDHHYLASKKYQLLEHHDEAPQLPTGYPGSMLLSLIPPLWFQIMNRRIDQIR